MKLESFTFSFLCPHIYVKKNENIFIAQEKKKNNQNPHTTKASSRENRFPIFHFAEGLISLDNKVQQKSYLSPARCFF